jgi:glycosyltransferase involved in cell wall biosynthesis
MNRKLRLLHIGNGRAFKIKAIIDAMLARGHEIHMIPIPASQEPMDGVAWHFIPGSSLPAQAKIIHRMLQVRSLVRKLRPDIVHAHNAWGPGWYGAATGAHPFVIHGYGGDLLPEQYQGRPVIQRLMTSWACGRADQIIVTGQHMVHASRNLGIDTGRVALLPRGVDLKCYRPGLDTSELRTRLGLTPEQPVILSPRYQVDEPLYNLETVLEAFNLVRAQIPAAVCVQMYGPGRGQGVDRLRTLASRLGIADGYRLVPAVDNVSMPLFYNLADVTVSVPSSDGFPVTVLEASACECPLIVTDLPYCKDWFTPRENGLVVAAQDPAALAGAICELLVDRNLRIRIGAAGRRLVAVRADYEHCMDNLERLYFNLLNRQSATHREGF